MSVPELASRLIQVAVLGPGVAALLWLLLAPWRWPRRILGGLVALASHAAAWWVFWLAYLGEGPSWQGLAPSLLSATAVAVAEVGILVAALRTERRGSLAPLVVVGLGVSTAALVLAGYTTSLVLLAIVVPIPTLAVLASSLLEPAGRRGLLGLAAADALIMAGLSIVFATTGTSAIAASTGPGIGLVLAGAALKTGAVVAVGGARLAAAEPERATPSRPLSAGAAPRAAPASVSPALRGQGILLAAIAAVAMAGGRELLPAAIAAGAASVLAGGVAVVARRPPTVAAAVIAAAGSVLFVALGLGGGFGLRAFLVSFPAVIIGAAVLEAAVAEDGGRRAGRPGRLARVAGILGAAVALGSLAGVPPGGGFPGTWMTVSVATARGVSAPGFYALAAAVLAGLALALIGGVRLLRLLRPGLGAALVAIPGALVLLYAGAQPVRLGIGWWIRIEEALRLPTVLPSAGGPALPAVGGRNLALALAPGLLLALLTVAAGRGVRAAPEPTAIPLGSPARAARPPGLVARLDAPARRLAALGRRPLVSLGAVLVVEAGAVALAVRLLVLATRAGFL